MKKIFVLLAVFMIISPTSVYADERNEIVLQPASIKIEAPFGGLEDGVIRVPASHASGEFNNAILLRRRMFDQYDNYMPIILGYGLDRQYLSRGVWWRLRDTEGNYTDDYFYNPDFESPYIYVHIASDPDLSQDERMIILTATSMARPEIHDQIKIIVDPALPGVFVGDHDGDIRQGLGGYITIPIGVKNIPDGYHMASILGIPKGLYVENWYHGQFYESYLGYVDFAVGYLNIIESMDILRLTAIQDVPGQTSGNAVIRIYFEGSDIWKPLPIPIGRQIHRIYATGGTDATIDGIVRPPGSQLFMAGLVSDPEGFWVDDTKVSWSIEGGLAGDYITSLPRQHAMLIFDTDNIDRTIDITITSVENPQIYSVVTVDIDPQFMIEPQSVRLDGHTTVWQKDGDNPAIAPGSFITIMLRARDSQGITMPGDFFEWDLKGAAPGDRLEIYPWGATLYTSDESETREITITVFATDDPAIYDTILIIVDPALPILPETIIEVQGTLKANTPGSITLTITSPAHSRTVEAEILNLPMGISIVEAPTDWRKGIAFHGVRHDAGRVGFDQSGIETITLESDGSLPVGQWDILLSINATTFETPHNHIVIFTLVVEM